MRRTLGTTIVVLSLLGSVGCDGDPDATPPAASTSSNPVTPAPTDSAEGPPVMPALARQRTAAGAKAFVRYYVDVLNYGFTQNQSHSLREVSLRRCTVCRTLADTIDENAAKGGGQVGGTWSPAQITLVVGQPLEKAVAVAALDVAKGFYRLKAGGHRHPIRAKRVVYEFWLSRERANWAVLDVKPT